MSHDRSANQRKSFRCAIPDPRQEAELKVGRKRWVVRLFNESSGGFAAWAPRRPPIQPGDVVQLRTADGWFEVRVVHISEVPPGTAPEEQEPLFRLGLERLRDLKVAPDEKEPGKRPPLGGIIPARLWVITVALLFVVLVGGIALATVAVLGNVDIMHGEAFGHWRKAPAPSPADERQRQSLETLAAVSRKLELSQVQEKHLQAVAEGTAGMLQELDRRWQNDLPEVRAQKQALLLSATRREIFRLLSPEQRQRWKALVEP